MKSILIEWRRHSLKGRDQFKDVLSDEGYQLAESVGKEQLRGKGFTRIATTTAFRTAQTAAAFARGAGDFMVATFDQFDMVGSEGFGVWKPYFVWCEERGIKGNDCHDIRNVVDWSPEFVLAHQTRLRQLLAHYLENVWQDGDHVLVVGHAPLTEMLVQAMTGVLIAPLNECEGIAMRYHSDKMSAFCEVVEEYRLT